MNLKFTHIHQNERWIIYTERGAGEVGLVFETVVRKIVIQFTAKPHNPAWIPHGLDGMGSPAQFPTIIRRANAVPVKRPIKIDFDEIDFTCTPR